MNKKWVAMILIDIAIIVGLIIYFGFYHFNKNPNDVKIDGVYLKVPVEIQNFQLTRNDGAPFSKANLQGKWTLLFFGFTNCGMVCPTTMAALNNMYLKLEKELPPAQLPQVVMISVDPDRDTVSRMNGYVKSFNPHFVGARGDFQQTIALEKQLHVAAVKLQVEGATGKNQYTVNHSAEIMLINPQGKLQAFLSYPHTAEQLVKDYKLILNIAS